MDSFQISQMNGMYMQQAANQMAYSQQLSSMGPPVFGGQPGGMYGDQMMGRAMNAGAAIGGPMASAMGMLAPMGISAGLGLGMAASTGIGMPIAAGVAGMQYAGSQVYTGAQQQQVLNQGLRSSFNFQNSRGGMGFDRADMSQIGSNLRSMASQFGPGGEITSFSELSQIASRMGQMGLSQGVKDVQEFSKRFKETVTALKTMAKDLGTTLEGAMEFASAARSSGIFGMQNASRFTSMARGTAAAGGLAMSEVTSMANIGSQISRSIGGLGRQGAVAGMKTIGQIGTAQQMGILSEEDIYNVTGQTGAEGRQAFAAASLQKAGGFLQSNKGRRLLASIAGKNGELDEGGVAELLGGGMSISETIRRDNNMKTSVGRANFIRNEGRLRGAALQEFGAFLPALQMREWAESKGVDINNMDDRSMLFAQRQLGMGRDEVDQAIKMAQNLPQIMEEMKSRQSRDAYMQNYAQARKGMGVEGIKQRLNQAKETVNNKLQKLGQDFFNDGSEAIDGFIKKMTGDYEQKFSEETEKAYRQVSLGTASPLANRELKGFVGTGKGLGTGPAGGLEAFRTRPVGASLFGGSSDADRFKAAGWDTSKAKTNADLSKMLQQFGDISRAANEPVSSKYLSLGGDKASWLDDAITSGAIKGTGKDRLDAFDKEITKSGSPEQKAAWERAKGDPSEQARIMKAISESRGITGEGGRMSIPDLQSSMLGKQMTESQRREAMAQMFTNKDPRWGGAAAGAALGGTIGSFLGLGGIGTSVGSWLGNKLGGDQDQRRALGAFLDSSEASKLYSGLRAGGQEAALAKRGAVNEIADLQAKGKLTVEETARLQGLQGSLAAAEYEAAGGENISKEKLAAIATAHGLSVDQVVAASKAGATIEGQKQAEQFRDLALQAGGAASKRMEALQGAGVATFEGGKVTLKASALGGQAKDIAQRLLQATALEARAGTDAVSGNLKGAYDEMFGAGGSSETRGKVGDELNAMTVEQKRAVARDLAKAGLGDESGMIFGMASAEDRLKKTVRRRGADKAVAESLGVTLDPDQLKAMKGASAEEKAKILGSALGVKSGAGFDSISKAIQDITTGKTGEASSLLRQVSASDEVTAAKKAQSLEAAKDANPLQDAMNKNLEAIKKRNDDQIVLLKSIATHTELSKDALANLGKDPEAGGANGGSATAQPGYKG